MYIKRKNYPRRANVSHKDQIDLRWVKDNAGYLTPWEGRLKRIESQFGRSLYIMMGMVVMMVMILMMWLMLMMLMMMLLSC